MKLLAKFNIVFAISFGAGLLIAAYFSHIVVQQNAESQVVQEARLMMETATAMRSYTSKQIVPLLESQREQVHGFMAQFEQNFDVTRNTPAPLESIALADDQKAALQTAWHQTLATVHDDATRALSAMPQDSMQEFHPQVVPAYAATAGFNYLREKYPEYTYREATLNPTNLQDRVTDWESDIVNSFRNNSALQELVGTRATPLGASVYLARPITIAQASCLECHSTPDAAPPAMIKAYGTANGFGWKLNETVGAQIVQVPRALPVRIANQTFYTVLISFVIVFLCTLLILNLTLYLMVIKPVGRMSVLADQISAGNINAKEMPVKGRDEISILANSFNRMQRSLIKALEMLND